MERNKREAEDPNAPKDSKTNGTNLVSSARATTPYLADLAAEERRQRREGKEQEWVMATSEKIGLPK